MNNEQEITPATVLHWNYRGFTEFPIHRIDGEELEITDIYLKENLISRVPKEICRLENLESLYLSGNDITELPNEISHLRCLKCLDISGNRLRRIPDEIGEMRSLKFLILDENELTELPLRLSELRALRYLSVCGGALLAMPFFAQSISVGLYLMEFVDDKCLDNQLQWLPQRPVYNYYHCEVRFWRNTSLKSMPYALWYHMYRDQQTRSLNIGCLSYPTYQHTAKCHKIRLKITQDSRQWNFDINTPSQHENILGSQRYSPPSLVELCKRVFYQIISDAAKRQTNARDDNFQWRSYNNVDHVRNVQQTFERFNLENKNNLENDINGNNSLKPLNNVRTSNFKNYYVPSDIIEEHFTYLPHFIRKGLCNGPISRCDNVECRRPIFDFVFYEFCFGKLILIDNVAEILLNATFCFRKCASVWKQGKMVIPWTLVES